MRDYEPIIDAHPKITEPIFFQDEMGKRIVHQVWDWHDDHHYSLHLYITQQIDHRWDVKHFVGFYRAITPKEIAELLRNAGLASTIILSPAETGFYQPIIKSTKPED